MSAKDENRQLEERFLGIDPLAAVTANIRLVSNLADQPARSSPQPFFILISSSSVPKRTLEEIRIDVSL